MPKKKIWGRCRLCHLDDWLVDSDIIPKFHYKPLKETEGRFYVLSTDASKKVIPEQKTITENLLCAQCDNERLSLYEGHLAKVIFGGHPLAARQDGPLLLIEGYDYKKIKNGLLSILWRMSISTNGFFSSVDLGVKHEERLRVALLKNIELPEEEYPILLIAPLFDGKTLSDLILEPTFARVGGNRIYRCLISGLIFTFIVGSAPLGEMERILILRARSWPVGRAKVEDIPFLHDACMRQSLAIRARKHA